jgi:hypothetical protein
VKEDDESPSILKVGPALSFANSGELCKWLFSVSGASPQMDIFLSGRLLFDNFGLVFAKA